MVNLYATLIINKRKTIDDVPAALKDAVSERLSEMGYDTNGDAV